MIIENFDSLATSSLRKQALLLAEAGLSALLPWPALRRQFIYDRATGNLKVGGKTYNLGNYGQVFVVGIGAGMGPLVAEVRHNLGSRFDQGFILEEISGVPAQVPDVSYWSGSTVYPSAVNIAATEELLTWVQTCQSDDLIIFLFGPGADTLLYLPVGLSPDLQQDVDGLLRQAGASTAELVTVRNHLSGVRAGHLAKICFPAQVLSLNFTETASGLLKKDLTTISDAVDILRKYKILEKAGLPSCDLRETPEQEKYFSAITQIPMVTLDAVIQAIKNKAADLAKSEQSYILTETTFNYDPRINLVLIDNGERVVIEPSLDGDDSGEYLRLSDNNYLSQAFSLTLL